MAKKLTRAEKIRRYIKENPTAKTMDIAKHFETRYQNVYAVRRKLETAKVATEANWKQIGLFTSDKPLAGVEVGGMTLTEVSNDKLRWVKNDPVEHPAHYKVGGIETIDFIEAKSLDYNLGNVVKYITRADYKGNKLEDLRKAQWYLTRAIETAK